MRDMKVIDVPRTSLEEVNAVAAIMRETAAILQARREQQTTMIQELNHRVKNTLATIQSISRMTIKNSSDLEGFETAFSARLMALSSTHDLLTESAWSGVELHELLTRELKAFVGSRMSIHGPRVTLSSKVAVALGMAVHELGTNAAKYGAWHGQDGSVRIDWHLAGSTLCFRWSERSDRLIGKPTGHGFGSRLIQQTIGRELQGEVKMDYGTNGLRAVFTFSLDVDDDRFAPAPPQPPDRPAARDVAPQRP
jgi:two-component sensor histidine kinase